MREETIGKSRKKKRSVKIAGGNSAFEDASGPLLRAVGVEKMKARDP